MTQPVPDLPAELNKMVQRFQRATEPKRRYEQLLWLAQKLEAFPEDSKIEANKVSGCVSQVYVTASMQDGKVLYCGDSDAQLTKGLLAFLIKGLNGTSPEDIVRLTPDFIQHTGLAVSLTPSRANGFHTSSKNAGFGTDVLYES
ncbi:MAG: SufE family protein [Coleofasciculaceae cyanobacterium RL_1_1]|nr:SufE family protein [Coleofasciculaceae cyanobacterium RL_1_1]